MQGQLLEELGDQDRQGGTRVVGQITDQAAGGHVRACLMQDVTGAFDLHIRAGNLHVVGGPANPTAGGHLVVLGIFFRRQILDGQRDREEGRRQAVAIRRGEQHRADLAAGQHRAGGHAKGADQGRKLGRRLFRGRIEILQGALQLGDLIAGVRQGRLLALVQVTLPDMRETEEAVRRAVTGFAADKHRQPLGLQMIDDRLDALAPGALQDFRIEQEVGKLAKQIRGDPAARGQVAIHADQGEAVVVDRRPVVFDHGAQLIILEVAVECGLGDLGLLLLVGQTSEQADLLQRQLALPQRLQHRRMDGGQGLQALDFQLSVAERGRDRLGVHLRLPQLADGGDDVGDVDRRMLSVRQHDGGGLLGRRLGQQAVDAVVVVDLAALAQQDQAKAPATAIERHEQGLALAPRSHDRRDDHAGGQQGVGQLRHAVIGRLMEAKVFLGEAKVAEAHLDAAHGDRRGRGLIGHRGLAPRAWARDILPLGAPARSLPPSFWISAQDRVQEPRGFRLIPIPKALRRQGDTHL